LVAEPEHYHLPAKSGLLTANHAKYAKGEINRLPVGFALTGQGELGWISTRAFSSGYNLMGLQPNVIDRQATQHTAPGLDE
jgi:hypothetical protein